MIDDPNRPLAGVSRRTALSGLGASALTLALGRRGAGAKTSTPEASTSEAFQEENDVVFGEVDGVALLLDIVRPADRPAPRPAVVLIHGGFTSGGRYELTGAARGLAAAGFVAFNIDYRLYWEQKNLWPAQLDDVQRAVRWVRANAAAYGVDPERIGALGWSSGGHFAAFLGTRDTRDNRDSALARFSSRVQCVVDMAGPMDLTIPYPSSYENRLHAEILGGTLEAPPDPAAYRDFSPITFVDETSSPFLIFEGGFDTEVPVEHAQRMGDALRAARVQVTYAFFPKYDHLTWGRWDSGAPETLAFFGRYLTPEQ